MAYIKKKLWPCQNDYCNKEGRYQVFNHRNSSMGTFCKPCAEYKKSQFNKMEKALSEIAK